MNTIQLAVAEAKARREGNIELADELQRQRWEMAMGSVINTENTGYAPPTRKLTS